MLYMVGEHTLACHPSRKGVNPSRKIDNSKKVLSVFLHWRSRLSIVLNVTKRDHIIERKTARQIEVIHIHEKIQINEKT